ncbi:DNA-directed RNA polymerase sigma-70 factor [Kroppenstedtia guangzhouensis]|jgi:RNA polymerase sigma-70 factor, ECF subfamily|uniref:DNA-directed RNA polymerase sigma-70 factor n=1 Tax=Kroppenstedtia guangzhouensis TaxID=1274356 RepID=A0ABQ1GRL7_9BACL|nr:sigma-70 family RNA polymerase sigma factor [Kroppenstedtia guangzhouensis]GGA48587.1 DNA-directed RNA polymerase sigma-70 factor [Kroppenstedtia guangzhouensis]
MILKSAHSLPAKSRIQTSTDSRTEKWRDRIEKARKGDAQAFQELIEEEKNKLYRMAYLYVRNENDALDLVQETVYKAYVSIQGLKNGIHFPTWLTRILINNALNLLKKKKRVLPMHELVSFQPYTDQRREERMDLLEAVNKLEEKYKTVVILRYYRDLTIGQIAEVLQCPEGTVKTNLHRAIAQLKSMLKEEGSDEPPFVQSEK